MISYIKPIAAAAVVLTLAGCSGLHVEAASKGSVRSGNATAAHFWDEIPVSPSTTAPDEIKDGYWHGQYQRVNRQVARADKAEIVFFGDSITWYWSQGSGPAMAQPSVYWTGPQAGRLPCFPLISICLWGYNQAHG